MGFAYGQTLQIILQRTLLFKFQLTAPVRFYEPLPPLTLPGLTPNNLTPPTTEQTRQQLGHHVQEGFCFKCMIL